MRLLRATGILVVAGLVWALPASASAADAPYPAAGFSAWDGANPFNCTNQDVGTGIDFPDPGADPFCVEFDKTQQNITDLGILTFALNEPTRLYQATDKCFYYQRDHWTGSIVQGEQPELWHWDGSYVIDRGTGAVGASLKNFRILGQSASPADYFPIPDQYKPFFSDHGINGILITGFPIDPTCAAKIDTPEKYASVYTAQAPAGGGSAADGGGVYGTPAPQSSTLGATNGSGDKKANKCRHRKHHRAARHCRKHKKK